MAHIVFTAGIAQECAKDDIMRFAVLFHEAAARAWRVGKTNREDLLGSEAMNEDSVLIVHRIAMGLLPSHIKEIQLDAEEQGVLDEYLEHFSPADHGRETALYEAELLLREVGDSCGEEPKRPRVSRRRR